jgi:hypothetical protein
MVIAAARIGHRYAERSAAAPPYCVMPAKSNPGPRRRDPPRAAADVLPVRSCVADAGQNRLAQRPTETLAIRSAAVAADTGRLLS